MLYLCLNVLMQAKHLNVRVILFYKILKYIISQYEDH